jgi:hypothetical protein
VKGTLPQLGRQMAKSFQELSPAQQEQTRKAMYESVTGKPYRERSALMDATQVPTDVCELASRVWHIRSNVAGLPGSLEFGDYLAVSEGGGSA